jgi:hypothetical protein
MDKIEFLQQAANAIEAEDYEALESLRDHMHAEYIPALLQSWGADLPWSKKDAYLTLLMDQTSEILTPMMEDGLNSPTVESRAYAFCILTKDFDQFNNFLVNSCVDAQRVDTAIALYKSGR